jgi:phosphoglycolate phosphatase
MTQKAVIFDLDGTLIDSLEDLANSVNQTLNEFGFNTHEINAYKYFIGDGVKVTLKRATDYKADDETITKLHQRFKVIYKKEIDTRTKVYNGIYELLNTLEQTQYPKAILSNKPHNFTLDCMDKFFPNYTFVNISGQKNTIEKKPNPDAALLIANEFKKDVKDIYFVGDTKVDMQTAKNAGMIAIGVLWGFREEKELRDNGADFIVSNTNELYTILSS